MSKKIILITGCSSGFGMLTAAQLSAKHKVYATMRDISKKDSLLEAVAKNKGEIEILPLDVLDKDSIHHAVETIKLHEGKLDVLINNAGISNAGYFEDLTDDEVAKVINTNFLGAAYLTKAALPLLRLSKDFSKIIMISSAEVNVPLPVSAAYIASKHALEGLAEGLVNEVKPFNIRLVIIQPSGFQTNLLTNPFVKGASNPASPYSTYNKQKLTTLDTFLDRFFSKHPEKVAKLIDKIIDKKKPHFRYAVGKYSHLMSFMHRVLPDSLRFYLMACLDRILFNK